MSDRENHEYMGDGVYAEFDGYSINIRVNDHRSPVVVVLEPQVFENLVNFYERCKSIAKEAKEDSQKGL